MTLAQNAQTLAKQLFNRLLARVDAERVRQAREQEAGKFPSALAGWTVECEDEVNRFVEGIRLALLAEWSAGEGEIDERDLGQTVACLGFGSPPPLPEMSAHDTLKAQRLVRELIERHLIQHRARLAAEREKWVARVRELEADRKLLNAYEAAGYVSRAQMREAVGGAP